MLSNPKNIIADVKFGKYGPYSPSNPLKLEDSSSSMSSFDETYSTTSSNGLYEKSLK